jgi:serine/threonine protein kinase
MADRQWQTNVLVDSSGQAVLSDFGLTVQGQHTRGRIVTSCNIAGNPAFMAPERIQLWDPDTEPNSLRIKSPADIYAYGCLCYAVRHVLDARLSILRLHFQVCTGRTPFQGKELAIVSLLEKRMRPPRPWKKVDCIGVPPDDQLWSLIERCWRQDPGERPHISNVLAYFGEITNGPLPAGAICIATAKEACKFS